MGLWVVVVLAIGLSFTGVGEAYGQQRSPDAWYELVTSIDRDVAKADAEHRKIPKLDAEDRRFIRKMMNELSVSGEAKPTAAQGQWLLAIRGWLDEALEYPLYPR